MTTTLEPTGRRTGATWVAATGAFLLLAGAAVFVAVQWRYLPDTAKVALVMALTASFLVGGRVLRRTLPATGDVLFHLGAFLLPVDLAGAGLDAGVGWRALLLAEGVLGVVALGGLGLTTGSVVLSWAGAASVMVLSAGVAALTPVPATVVLVAIAAVVHVSGGTRARRAVAVWAGVAGLAPVIGAALSLRVHIGAGTLADLGLAGPDLAYAGLVAGVAAAVILARQAHQARDLVLAYLALACAGVGISTSLLAADLAVATTAIGLGGVFAVVELAALVTARDPFWSEPIALVAEASKYLAGFAALLAGFLVAGAPFVDTANGASRQPELAAALALVAFGWVTADVRRGGGRSLPAMAAAAICGVAAVEVGAASRVATAVCLLVVAGLLLLSRRPTGYLLIAALAPWALVTSSTEPITGALVGLGAAVVMAEAAVRCANADRDGEGIVLATLAAGGALIAVTLSLPSTGEAGVVTAAITALWLLSLLLDRGSSLYGDLARAALLVPVAAAFVLEPGAAATAMAAVTVLYAVDAVRLQRPEVGIGAALAMQALVAEVALASGIHGAPIGLALSISAVVWAGLAAVVDGEWRLPFTVAAACGTGLGLILTSGDASVFGTDLLIAGCVAIAAGIATRNSVVAHLGGAAVTSGIAIHLALAGETALEPYLIPVAVQLLIAGHQARRHDGVSSWVAYTPAVVLLGGAALSQRVGGGAPWHSLVAGAVGVVAVSAGGWHRLVGPMVAGTILLVAVTLSESLSALAGVPTWAWLAAGGSVLLAVGIALERSDTSPSEAGRRVVEVLADRYQ